MSNDIVSKNENFCTMVETKKNVLFCEKNS